MAKLIALTPVRRAAERAVAAHEARDRAIRAAHEQGATVRAIAAVSGLSSARIHQIIHGR
jgi:hypothetical protein